MRIKLRFSKVIALSIVLFSMQALAGVAVIRVNENESGKVVNVEVGDTVEIYLESNPTTGYQWAVDQLDQAILKQGESNFIAASVGVGVVGHEVIRFKAVKKAKTFLRLVYRRSFERSVTPIKSFNLDIIVKGN